MHEERTDDRAYSDPPSWVAGIHEQADDDSHWSCSGGGGGSGRSGSGSTGGAGGYGEGGSSGSGGRTDDSSGGGSDSGSAGSGGVGGEEGFPTHLWDRGEPTAGEGEGDPPPGDEGYGGH